MEVRDSLTKWSVASPEEGYAEGDDGDTSSAPGRPTPIIADPDATSILG